MSGGGKSKSSYRNPVSINSMMQWVGIGAIRAYSGTNSIDGNNLDINKFMETVKIEVEKDDLSNIGHPLYRPFMTRRYGEGIGLATDSQLAYDNINTRWWAWNQLEEGMRVTAAGKIATMNDWDIQVGETIAVEDDSLGVRRTLLVEGVTEDANGVELELIDVLGG